MNGYRVAHTVANLATAAAAVGALWTLSAPMPWWFTVACVVVALTALAAALLLGPLAYRAGDDTRNTTMTTTRSDTM